MSFRLASISFLLGSLATGVTWLTVQPPLVRLLDAIQRHTPEGSPAREVVAQVRALLPYYLGLDLLLMAGLCFAVLHLAIARPLRRTEEAVEQLSRLELDLPLRPAGGPLLSRLERSLKRMADALLAEQALTRRQLAELREANLKLRRAQTELVASERLVTVGRLAAGVAHEVGNPLSGILGYLSVIRARAGQSPEVVELLGRVDGEVQRIDQIVRGLLELGRPARGSPGPVEVARIAEACARLLSAGPDFGAVEIKMELEPGAVAQAEQGPLSQVLINLLLNAAQAMGGKGAIRLAARRQGERIAIEVEDTGPGIPPEVMPRLFEPFFTTKAGGKGNGLGLAVSRHLLSAMGGELTADNGERGARFTVTLPAV
ncbi:MAG: two-component sensor histidine kinase [Myxococcales bacterium]|nr:two-component sensor histidine kinase [Myxococcales bacterium]